MIVECGLRLRGVGNGNVLKKPITELIFTSFPFFSICMSISELSVGNIMHYSFYCIIG